MPDQPTPSVPVPEEPADSGENPSQPQDQDDLLRKVAERVWELLREDLRRESERTGGRSRR